jgi:predicted dehydrogenase
MRALLVGAGGMGQAWAKSIRDVEGVELAGWVDVMPGQARKAAEQNGIETLCFESLAQGLKESGADFVVDVTIPEAHENVTIESLQFGLPVLGEKPMATSMAAAKRMVFASEQAGKLYMVSQSRRYDGRLTAYRRLVEGLGQLGIINVDFYLGAHFGGFRDMMEHVLILDMAIHTFDAARAITGLNPVSVYAEEFNPVWSWYSGASSATCLFTMENDARLSYRGSWASEGLNSSWEGDWRVVGEKGSATWNGFDAIKRESYDQPVVDEFVRAGTLIGVNTDDIPSGIKGSLLEFVDALKTGKTPQGECHDNILSLAMVFGAIESSKRAERVTIEEMLA